MTQLENAMASIMQIFDKYASTDGNSATLSKGEVKTLVEKELPALIKGAKSPADVDKFLKCLDHNNDSEVDFEEFVVLVASITCMCHGRKK